MRPADAVVVNESTSTLVEQAEWLPTVRSGSFFATGSGGIGWGVPGAVGVALGDRANRTRRVNTSVHVDLRSISAVCAAVMVIALATYLATSTVRTRVEAPRKDDARTH